MSACRPVFVLRVLLGLYCVVAAFSLQAATATTTDQPPIYNLKYTVELQPKKDRARVTITVDRGDLLRHISFPKRAIYTNIKANGTFVIKDGRGVWDLPEKNARMTFLVKISNQRDPGRYDARMTADWAIFRGDDLIPAVYTNEVSNAEARATLVFKLPDDWSVETGWPRIKGNTFRIDNPERRFDRPVGWMIAGKLGTRRTQVGNTNVAVSSPKGESLRRMDALTFLTFVWPQVQNAFGETPAKLLIVGAGDPMWRGGLSASNSLFLHADRPLVSENGTSSLVHELVHMVTRISGVQSEQTGKDAADKEATGKDSGGENGSDTISDDWIAEGIAEFYSFELMYRAGAMTRERRQAILKRLGNWGEDVAYLRQSRSSGPVTARAVVLLDQLDQEIRAKTKNKRTLDDVVRALMPIRRVSLDDLRKAAEATMGAPVTTLDSPLLTAPSN
jgi:predicted metalloprotease with PDZ domain